MANLIRSTQLAVVLSFFFAFNAHALKPLALVWNGPGACKPSCAAAANRVTQKAGFRIRIVKPGFNDEAAFQEAKLWVQPGGKSTAAAKAMGPELLARVVEFVRQGGGYVGFCAGGFLSTPEIGTSKETGLGIIPGETQVLIDSNKDHQMLKLKTVSGSRLMYYAGGPYFKVTDEELKSVNGEVLARYADGKIAGIRAHFGKGKVAVIGTHPEAGFLWKILRFKIDRDGSDRAFVINEMIRYATNAEE